MSCPRFRCHLFSLAIALCLQSAVMRVDAHGTYHELVNAATEKITAQPDHADLYVERSRLHLEHGDWQSALIDLERSDRLSPSGHLTEILRAQALMMAGQWDAAKPVLDGFLKLQPHHPAGLLERARVLSHQGQQAAALADYRLSLAQTKNAEPDLYQEVAMALEKGGHPEEAIQVLAEGLNRFGAVPSMALVAMELESKHGHFDAALSRVDVMQATAPRPEPWMAKRASLLAQAGRFRESEIAWRSLADHLAALPNLERGSHAMSLLAEQALNALSALQNLRPTLLPTPGASSAPSVSLSSPP